MKVCKICTDCIGKLPPPPPSELNDGEALCLMNYFFWNYLVSSPNAHYRFSNFVLLNQKLEKEIWQYIQNLGLNPAYVLEPQT